MIRLGVAVRVLGKPTQHDTTPSGDMSLALLRLRDTLEYLHSKQISCYRLPDTLLPNERGISLAERLKQVEMQQPLLAEIGQQARRLGIRLSLHPGLHVMLATADASIAQRASDELAVQATLLDALGCGPEAVIVLHVGGAQGDPVQALERFATTYERLAEPVRQRIVVEADDHSFDIAALLWLRRWCGIRLVFDLLHHQLHNPSRMPQAEALGLALASWPPGVRPKIHISSQRTEAHLRPARSGAAPMIIAPRRGQHADFLNPFEVAALVRSARDMPPFDMMLEAKAADLALLRLREDLRDFAPDVAGGVA